MTEEEAQQIKFSAIFILSASIRLLSMSQIICDLAGSKDGSPVGPRRSPKDPQVVTFITTSTDVTFAAGHSLPRFSGKTIEICASAMFKEIYGVDLEVEHYGKPLKVTGDYIEKRLREKARKEGFAVSKVYMIGDSPQADIAQAIGSGWTSILVKTGIVTENDP